MPPVYSKPGPPPPPAALDFLPFSGERYQKVVVSGNRDAALPRLVLLQTAHPRLADSLHGIVKRVFVYRTDTSPSYLEAFHQYAEEYLNIHEGPDHEMVDSGEFASFFQSYCSNYSQVNSSSKRATWCLREASTLPVLKRTSSSFLQSERASSLLTVLLLLTPGSRDQQIPADALARLHELRNDCLGPFDERDPKTGETKLEKDQRWDPVGGEGRCQSMGLNIQRCRNVANPAAAGKSSEKNNDEDDDDYGIRIRGEITKVRRILILFFLLLTLCVVGVYRYWQQHLGEV